MELNPFIQRLRDEVAVAAEAGGAETAAVADRLMAPLDSAIRLTLLEALSSAAAEITSDLAPGSVELRLRGREPEFVVTLPPADEPADSPVVEPSAWVPAEGDDSATARINLRLPQDLKDRVDEAARSAGLSANAWLVRSVSMALAEGGRPAAPAAGRRRGGDRYSGWVR
jgi:hypothetical protein